jgi:sugar-specific transcriptional regulator TrmB
MYISVKKILQMIYLDSLQKLGLTEDQAKIYEILVSCPVLPARIISKKSGVSRELTYVVLKQLENLDLLDKSTKGKIILFRAKNPRNIKKILETKKESTLVAEKAYQDIIGSMIGDYNIANSKPYIRFYEGIEGLQKTYDHILKYAKNVYVIRSLYDYENKEVRKMITDQLKKQAEKNIKSYVLTPHLSHMSPEKLTHNLERKITRKIIPSEKLTLPSQIIIYNNTVSITSIKKDLVTTIIENEDIAQTFMTLFNYMWDTDK